MKSDFENGLGSLFMPADEETEYIPLISDEDEVLENMNVPDVIPVLPLRNTVLFPGVVIPITVGREKSIKLVQDVYKKNKILGAVSQMDANVEEPGIDDLFGVGTVAQILKILEMPDGSTSVIIQGRKRFKLEDILTDKPYHIAKITPQ